MGYISTEIRTLALNREINVGINLALVINLQSSFYKENGP